MGAIVWVLALMTQTPSDRPTDILQGWFRDAGLTGIADILGSPAVGHVIRHYAVWVLIFIGLVCFAWPFISTVVMRLFINNDNVSAQPDMKVSDAIDYIVNDSKTIFDVPQRPETPIGLPFGAKMSVVGALHTQARRRLSDKINTGEIKTWGLRQIDTHIAKQFELSLREIPASYWDDMQLDFHSALFYKGPYSQTTKIPGRTATYNWANINVSRTQIESLWPKKFIAARLYNTICRQRVSYSSEFK
jgi:hypothetical protein